MSSAGARLSPQIEALEASETLLSIDPRLNFATGEHGITIRLEKRPFLQARNRCVVWFQKEETRSLCIDR